MGDWTRPARYVGAAAVALIAAYASYGHMRAVAFGHGESAYVSALLPLSVDGMLLVAAVAMVDDRRRGQSTSRWTWAAFLVGVGASLAANILHARPDLIARAIAAWPPAALLLTVELLSHTRRAVAVEPAQTVTTKLVSPAVGDKETASKLGAPPAASDEMVRRRLIAQAARDSWSGRRLSEALTTAGYGVGERVARKLIAQHRQRQTA